MEEKKEFLLEKLKTLGQWHHSIDLGYGVRTAPQQTCYDPLDRWKVIERNLPADLSGKSVLDLGCNSGYFSVLMKQRGAGECVAVDVFSQSTNQARFLSDWFNVEFEVITKDAHEFVLTSQRRFDYVLFTGLFYHLKYPVLVLDRLAEMVKERLFFQTVVVEESASEFKPCKNFPIDEMSKTVNSPSFPRMMFIENEFNSDKSNWWICSKSAVPSLLRSARLRIVAEEESDIYVCEPDKSFGKKICLNALVFPRYGKGSWFLPKDE